MLCGRVFNVFQFYAQKFHSPTGRCGKTTCFGNRGMELKSNLTHTCTFKTLGWCLLPNMNWDSLLHTQISSFINACPRYRPIFKPQYQSDLKWLSSQIILSTPPICFQYSQVHLNVKRLPTPQTTVLVANATKQTRKGKKESQIYYIKRHYFENRPNLA